MSLAYFRRFEVLLGSCRALPPLRLTLELLRPHTLVLALAPILVAASLAARDGAFSPYVALLCLICALSLQMTANLANEYFDCHAGIDEGLRHGPIRALQRREVTAAQVIYLLVVCLLVGLVSGMLLVAGRSLWWWLVGAVCIAAAVGYSAGAKSLANQALGELAALAFFGPIAVLFTYYLQVGQWRLDVFAIGLAVGFHAASVMLVNNTRDRASDAEAGRRTLAVRLPPTFTKGLFVLFLLAPYALSYAIGAHGTLWLAPLSSVLALRFTSASEGQLNQLLPWSAHHGFAFAVAVSVVLLSADGS